MSNRNGKVEIRDNIRNTLLEAVISGKSLQSTDIDDNKFMQWFELSQIQIKKALNNSSYIDSVESDYLGLLIQMLNKNIAPPKRLEYCIMYLTDIIDAI